MTKEIESTNQIKMNKEIEKPKKCTACGSEMIVANWQWTCSNVDCTKTQPMTKREMIDFVESKPDSPKSK